MLNLFASKVVDQVITHVLGEDLTAQFRQLEDVLAQTKERALEIQKFLEKPVSELFERPASE